MRKLLFVLPLLTLAACNSTSFLAKEQPAIAALCGTASMLSPMAGPYAPFIIGACGTEAAVAKLALDPSSAAWLQDIIDKVHGLHA